jgi:vitamin B12 transporter
MNEFDADGDWDGLVEDRDRVSEFRNSTVGLQANYASVDGRWQHKLLLAKSKHDNEAFADGEKGNETASTKDQYQYIGSMFWNDGTQRISILAEREQEDFQQRGPITSWGADPNQDRERDTDSFAVEYRTDISDSLSLALSSRYDDNSEFDSANTHRVEAVYQLDDSMRLRAAYGTAVKNPTFSERFGTYTNFVGNPNLEPEESTSWEAGIDQQLGELNLSATLFDSTLENEINGFADAGNYLYTAENMEGTSHREGVELTVSSQMNDDIAISAAYTYTDSVAPDSDGVLIDEIRRARHAANVNLVWLVKDNLTINANAQHNGKQTDIGDVTLDAFTLVNLNASYRASDKLDIYLRLDNLLDEDYEEVFGYQTLGFGASLGVRFDL